MSTSRHLWIPILVLLAAAEGVSAQSSTEPRIEKLEESIRILERRITLLEQQINQRNEAVAVPPDRMNWRKLQKGMSSNEVEKLLGSPSKVDVFTSFTVWHYGYPLGGRVEFDDRSRSVTRWHEPDPK